MYDDSFIVEAESYHRVTFCNDDSVCSIDYAQVEALLAASTDGQIKRIYEKWQPFIDYRLIFPLHEGAENELSALRDTRELALIAMNLKRLAKSEGCTKKDFENVGVAFGLAPNGRARQDLSLHYVLSSPEMIDYLWVNSNAKAYEDQLRRSTEWETGKRAPERMYSAMAFVSTASVKEIRERSLFCPGQEQLVSELPDDSRCAVMNVYSLKHSDDLMAGAQDMLDYLLKGMLQGLSVEVSECLPVLTARNHFTSFWLTFSRMLSESRVDVCRGCGRPILATKERGNKKKYCGPSCRRKYKKALQFEKMLHEGVSEKEAATKAGIAAKTAKDILARNGLDERSG